MNSSFNRTVELLDTTRPRRFPWLNVLLFAATCLSTLFIGSLLMAAYHGVTAEAALDALQHDPRTLLSGLPFCATLMSILVAHEMGHYLTCRYYGIDATLPYFIPFPNLIGTLGAFIRIRSPFQDRGSLLDVGVAGPIAGFIVAVLALAGSIGQSRMVTAEASGLKLGEPIIFKTVEYVLGTVPPEGMDSSVHPVTLAALFGFLVTALNLLPAAQLDGGHITYALFGRYHKWISWGVIAALLPLAVFYWWVWGVWIAILLILRPQHPATLNDSIPLRRRHIVLGWIALAMLILCFTAVPLKLQ